MDIKKIKNITGKLYLAFKRLTRAQNPSLFLKNELKLRMGSSYLKIFQIRLGWVMGSLAGLGHQSIVAIVSFFGKVMQLYIFSRLRSFFKGVKGQKIA